MWTGREGNSGQNQEQPPSNARLVPQWARTAPGRAQTSSRETNATCHFCCLAPSDDGERLQQEGRVPPCAEASPSPFP